MKFLFLLSFMVVAHTGWAAETTLPAPDSSGPQTTLPQNALTPRAGQPTGIVHPHSVDPGIHVAIPPQNRGGSMPIIKPPGTSGGRAAPVPK